MLVRSRNGIDEMTIDEIYDRLGIIPEAEEEIDEFDPDDPETEYAVVLTMNE